jgi:tetratricopeptide (TPR) repeat protein
MLAISSVVLDKLIGLIYDYLKEGGENLAKDRHAKSDIKKAIEEAANRFANEYEDKDLACALTGNTKFYDLPSVRNAIIKILEQPIAPTQYEIIENEFETILPKAKKGAAVKAARAYMEILYQELTGVKKLRDALELIFRYRTMKASEQQVKAADDIVLLQKESIGVQRDMLEELRGIKEKVPTKGEDRDLDSARRDYLVKFIDKFSAPPVSLLDLGNYEQLPLQLQMGESVSIKKKKSIADWGVSDYKKLFSGQMGHDEIDIDEDPKNLFSDEIPNWEPKTDLPIPSRTNKIRYRLADIDFLPQKFVLTGPQGSGKTTLLHKEALSTATRALQDPDRPIPVLINLWEWKKGDPFTVFIRNLQSDRLRPIWRYLNIFADLQDLIISNEAILYLDGLDELDQERLLELKQIVQDLTCQVVMTYRVDQYGGTMDFGFSEVAIQPLQIDDIRKFASSRLGLERSKDFVNQLRVWEDEGQGNRNQDLLLLASVPFFLVMMLSHYDVEGWDQVPNRWQLLNYITTQLWKNIIKNEKVIDRTQIKPFENVEILIKTLSPIALSHLSTKDIPIEILKNKVTETVIKALFEAGLISGDSQSIRFRHTIFQEFLAAHELAAGDLEPFLHSQIYVGMLEVLASSDEEQRKRVQTAILTQLALGQANNAQTTKSTLWLLGEIGNEEALTLLFEARPENMDPNQEAVRTIAKMANRLSDERPIKAKVIESIGRILVDEPPIATGDPIEMLWLAGMRFGEMIEVLAKYTDTASVLAEIKCTAAAKILVEGYLKFTGNFSSKQAPGFINVYRMEFLRALAKMGKATTPFLLPLVWNDDPLVCITAAEALSFAWIDLPVQRLIPILVKHPIPLVRAHIAIALGDLQEMRAVPFLIDALHDNGLASYGTAGPYQGINQVFLYVSDAAAYAVAQFDSEQCQKALLNNGYSKDGHLTLDLLLERLKSDRDVSAKGSLRRQWARYAAGMQGGIQALLPCLGHIHRGPDGPSPITAALLEREKIGERPIGLIKDFIENAEDRAARIETTLLLAEMGDESIDPFLRHLISSDTDVAIRMTAAGALLWLIARHVDSYSYEDLLTMEGIIASTLKYKESQGGSGFGRGIVAVARLVIDAKETQQVYRLIQLVSSLALELVNQDDISANKTGLVVLEELAANAEVYRWGLERVVDNGILRRIQAVVESSPSFQIRRSLNKLEGIKYLGVTLGSKDDKQEDEEGEFPRRGFFIQETNKVLDSLKEAIDLKSESTADWAKNFSEEDWSELGCDNGQIWFLIGQSSDFLGNADDARIAWTRCIDYYRGIYHKTEKQKITLVRALLSFESHEDKSRSDETFLYLKQATGVALELTDPMLQLETLTAYELACRDKKEWKLLVETSEKAAELTEPNPHLRDKYVLALSMAGQGYIGMEDFVSAMLIFQRALQSAEEADLLEITIAIRVRIAILNGLNDEPDFIIEMKKITDYYDATEQWEQAAETMLFIGDHAFPKMIPVQAQVYESALDYLEKDGACTDPYRVAYILRKFTGICFKFEKTDEARSTYIHWMDLISQWKSKDSMAIILVDYAYLLAHLGQIREAEKSAIHALHLLGPDHEMMPAAIQAFHAVRENPQWRLPTERVWQLLQSCLFWSVYDPQESGKLHSQLEEFITSAREGGAQPEQELGQGLLQLVDGKPPTLRGDNPYRKAFETLLTAIERANALDEFHSPLFNKAVKLSRLSDPDSGFELIKSSPELLGPKGGEVLGVLLENAKSLRDEDGSEILDWALDLTKLSQECGSDVVLSEMSKAPRLREALSELTDAHTPKALRNVLLKYPELLSKEIDKTLELAIRVAELGDETRLLGYLKYNRSLIKYLQTRGVERVVEEMKRSITILRPLFEYIWSTTDAEARTILESHPEILSVNAEALLQSLATFPGIADDMEKTSTLFRRLAILRISHEVGSKVAFEELLPFMQWSEVFFDLISTRDETSIRNLLDHNPILISDEMNRFLGEVLEMNWSGEYQGILDTITLYREFLARCQSEGVAKAMDFIRPSLHSK